MYYPQLKQKIDILNKKFRIDPATIARKIEKDKSTAWRWLYQRTDRLSLEQQQLLVNAVCEAINKSEITEALFRSNNILMFCLRSGLSKYETAIYSNLRIPVPEIMLDNLFDLSSNLDKYSGFYLLYRHDKEQERPDTPYLQACATIRANERGFSVYEDIWADDYTRQYEGFVYSIGSIVNIVGQSKSVGKGMRLELWWCGLKVGSISAEGKVRVLYGYVSDMTDEGVLFTDRLVLVRVPKEKWEDVREKQEFFASRDIVVHFLGDKFIRYLEEWIAIPISEPDGHLQ